MALEFDAPWAYFSSETFYNIIVRKPGAALEKAAFKNPGIKIPAGNNRVKTWSVATSDPGRYNATPGFIRVTRIA